MNKRMIFLGFLLATNLVHTMDVNEKTRKYNENLNLFNRLSLRHVDAGSELFLFEPAKNQDHLIRQIGLSNGMLDLNVEAVRYWLQESIVYGDDIWQAYWFSLDQATPSHTPKRIDILLKQREIYKLFPSIMHQQMLEQAKYEVGQLQLPSQKNGKADLN